MSILAAQNVVYMVQNSLTGEFLTSLKGMTFSGSVWDGAHFPNRAEGTKARTAVRAALANDVPAIAIDIVRVRADVRRGTRGRPRKIAETV
jgi:hypothetical protein